MYLGRRAEPVGNKKLHKLEVQRRQEALRARLATVRPSIDNAPPKTMGIKPRNLKKEQLLEDRYSQIEHENRVLLTRMSEIMNKPSMDTVSEAWTYGHSLNRERRRRELQRITEENLGLLKRIQAVQPVYSADRWEEERLAQEALVEAICEYKEPPLLAPYAAAAGGGVGARGGSPDGERARSRSPEPGPGAAAAYPAGGYSGGAGAPLYSARDRDRGGGVLAGGGRAIMGMPGAASSSAVSMGGGGAPPLSARSSSGAGAGVGGGGP